MCFLSAVPLLPVASEWPSSRRLWLPGLVTWQILSVLSFQPLTSQGAVIVLLAHGSAVRAGISWLRLLLVLFGPSCVKPEGLPEV